MPDLMTRLLDLAELPADAIPGAPRAAARASLHDWLACGLAGRAEPVAAKMRAFCAAEGGRAEATLFGGGRAPARMAALVNGTISHAIDFDDTHFAHVGHLSVGLYPAALAAGEATGASAAQVTDAFLIGAEGAIRTGLMLGRAHYDRGFHQTATAGAFGATLAAGRLMGLNRDRMRAALGLCATRASGLKSQFGTMGKPLNAGLSAANGIEAATLAQLGLTSCEDGLEGAQGFVATHSDAPGAEAAGVAPVGDWLFPAISYKFHACCHGTHAMIEALRDALGDLSPLDGAAVTEIALRVNPRWLSVCDIAAPRTGLEVKFSYRWLAALVLAGADTAADASFTDAIARDPALATLAAKVRVTGDGTLGDMQTAGEVTLADGRRVALWHDLAEAPEPDRLRDRLTAKARALLGPRADALSPVLDDMPGLRAADLAALLEGGE